MPDRKTRISIDGEDWLINGEVTYSGREYRGWRIEGLLMNSRMASGIFDDENPLTAGLWKYPDTGEWDADRNTNELIAMLPVYRAHGMNALPFNLQNSSPLGYYRRDPEHLVELRKRIHADHPGALDEDIWAGLLLEVESQPWISGAFNADGSLKPAFMDRTARLIDAADDNGMAVILGLFYQGQDERLTDTKAVKAAVTNACAWVLDQGYTNVVIEISNEVNVPTYEHPILKEDRNHELIDLAKGVTRDGKRLLVSTSWTRRSLPTPEAVASSDYILLHGNGMVDSNLVSKVVDDTRAVSTYTPKPVVFNEDDHFNFDQPLNNFTAALSRHAGWGYFDPAEGAGGTPFYGDYENGYQCPPVNWGINTPRKKAFFEFLKEVTGV
ncbi:MAG: hypothetical protein O3C10_06665 [Chloroflexi bacterium]|nr:hypothetical protein [Chloroflexota bacterium]